MLLSPGSTGTCSADWMLGRGHLQCLWSTFIVPGVGLGALLCHLMEFSQQTPENSPQGELKFKCHVCGHLTAQQPGGIVTQVLCSWPPPKLSKPWTPSVFPLERIPQLGHPEEGRAHYPAILCPCPSCMWGSCFFGCPCMGRMNEQRSCPHQSVLHL